MFFENLWKDYGSITVKLIIIFLVGLILINIVMKLLSKVLKKSKINITAHKFILSILKFILLFILVLILLETIGVKTSSILAALGVVGLAVSLAVQNSLSNVFSGFILLLTKPFEVKDYIQINGVEGSVEHVNIVNTKLITIDNKAIYIPNSQITDSVVMNFTREEQRRLDLTFSISYQNDFREAKQILSNIVLNHPLALKDPEPVIRLCEHGNSALKIIVRVWVKSEDYWNLNFDLLENVKLQFDEAGIQIPYEHLDVIIHNDK